MPDDPPGPTESTDPVPPASPTVATALGRHGLALIARDLRDRGITRIAVPAFHCATMTLPFQMEGMHVERIPVGTDLMLDPSALDRTITRDSVDSAPWAVLHCELFGAPGTPDLLDALARARERGNAVVIDTTHTWPEPPHAAADFGVASIRKLLDLPDGALVWGLSEDGPRPAPRSDLDREETRLWLAGEVDAAEDVMDRELTPVAMSEESLGLAAGIDLGALMKERREAIHRLHDGLEELGLTPISPREGHFCVAFRHRSGQALVLDLAHKGIDGPVWWPRPQGWQGPWPDDLVSLPATGGRSGAGRLLGQMRDALAGVPPIAPAHSQDGHHAF